MNKPSRRDVVAPVFEGQVSIDTFYFVALLLALQNESSDMDSSVSSMLAYWRADHNDFDRHEIAYMLAEGRKGYDNNSIPENLHLLLEFACDSYGDNGVYDAISADDMNKFIRWGINEYVEWKL